MGLFTTSYAEQSGGEGGREREGGMLQFLLSSPLKTEWFTSKFIALCSKKRKWPLEIILYF